MADKASLFKHAFPLLSPPSPKPTSRVPTNSPGPHHRYLTKSLGALHGTTPTFMAKPSAALPGNSGHIQLSLTSRSTGQNLSFNCFLDPTCSVSDHACSPACACPKWGSRMNEP
ncbi:hypothetical protein SLS58_009517 [Diplodia intermedia]|uniref:GS catalytic domain-containing protein n=1 Tax=Diplodia intermedia TaxID=856260 RepID=A0ABR3TCB0_9PEZI